MYTNHTLTENYTITIKDCVINAKCESNSCIEYNLY